MNLFEKNRNELSKYFYDLSKAVLLASVAIPIFQEKATLKMGIVGVVSTMIPDGHLKTGHLWPGQNRPAAGRFFVSR